MTRDLNDRLLRLLASHDGPPLHVEAIATRLDVSASFASQRLQRLEQQRRVRRQVLSTESGRKVVYALLPWTDFSWSSPRHGIVLRWRALGEMDWAFPLLSQVPDAEARTTVRDFLTVLRKEGLLDASGGPTKAPRKDRALPFHGLTAVVFGSTARTAARPGADVDLFVLASALTGAQVTRIHDIAAEVSLQAPRALQLLLFGWDGRWEDVSPSIRPELERDGLIVHDGLRDARRGGAERLWSLVYGGRSGD